MGMVLTFAIVLISSWRVSRLNVVRAIRDLPEPSRSRKSLKGLVLSILLPLAGAAFTYMGYQDASALPFNIGVSFVIVGVPLVARRAGLPNRAAFSIAGLGLVVWWLLPSDFLDSFLSDMQQGIEMFFLSGIMLVVGAVWAIMYNSDLILAAMVRLLCPFSGLAPVVRTAVAYPMQNRLRTGMTLAMFSLIVFTLTVMGFIISGTDAVLEDSEGLSGGYHVRARVNPSNPIADIREALKEADGVNLDAIEAIASRSGTTLSMEQEGTDNAPVERWFIRGVDPGYTDSVTHDFALMAGGYGSDRDVWRALQDEPNTTVYILAKDARSGNEERLRVIGVLPDGAGYVAPVMTSQSTLDSLLGTPLPPRAYMFRLKEGVDADATSKALKAAFFEHGMQSQVIAEEIKEEASQERLMNMLLEGFMGLGLVVGIAALGVIAARSVVERRQHIGVLRVLGFQKEMVQLSFLLEASFVALLGIAIGVALGAFFSHNIITELSKDIRGLEYRVPWLNIAAVVVIAYGASLLTTFLPARQASKVYPAEALRFE